MDLAFFTASVFNNLIWYSIRTVFKYYLKKKVINQTSSSTLYCVKQHVFLYLGSIKKNYSYILDHIFLFLIFPLYEIPLDLRGGSRVPYFLFICKSERGLVITYLFLRYGGHWVISILFLACDPIKSVGVKTRESQGKMHQRWEVWL